MNATVTYAKQHNESNFGFAVKYGKKTIAVAMEGGMWYDNGEFNYSIVSLSSLSSGKFTDVCKNAIRKAIKNYHEMAE